MLILVVGPSGAGKDTFAQGVQRMLTAIREAAGLDAVQAS